MRQWIWSFLVAAALCPASFAADTLTLNVTGAGGGALYVQPGANVVIDLNVSGLQQPVNACQALLGYSSTYFHSGTVAPGGGVWTELIYQSWVVPGQLDTAVGLSLSGPSGTQAAGTVAMITVTAKDVDGLTQFVFRPDGPGDFVTMLSTVDFLAVLPVKVDSQDIVVDGTPPVVEITSATQNVDELLIESGSVTYAYPGAVDITVTAADATAGLASPPVVTITPSGGTPLPAAFVNEAPAGTFHYTWTVTSTTPNGVATIEATATDNSGNSAAAVVKHFVTQNQTPAPDTLTLDAVNTIGNVLYVQPGGTVVIDLEVSNLQQMVNACQALIGYSSTYLNAGTVAPGDPAVWSELIYESWAVAGELDTAIGVKLSGGPAGTQADGTVAVITLTAGSVEGLTHLIFRPDGENGYATILSTLAHEAVYPTRINSQDILIDGTPPEPFAVAADTACTADLVTLTFATTDALSGIHYYEIFVDGSSRGPATSPHALSLAGEADGPHSIVVKAFDKAGNMTVTPPVVVQKDGTPPAWTSGPAVDTVCTLGGATLTAAAWDAGCAGGASLSYELDGGGYVPFTSPVTLMLGSDGDHVIKIKAADSLGNETAAALLNVTRDTAPPAISNVQAVQNGASVLCPLTRRAASPLLDANASPSCQGCPAEAAQGVVDISVAVIDVGCAGVTTPPTVTVAGIGTATFVTGVGNTYHYSVAVTSTTANGPHAITVDAADALGNAAQSTSTMLCVNKNQITGTVEFDTFSSVSYNVTRDVVFKATDAGGTVLATWTVPVTFTNAGPPGLASGGYTLTHVPANTASLSAKTAWHLRRKLTVTLDADGQGIGAFTRTTGKDLRGGDIRQDNTVNILDYSTLKNNWNSTNAAADINGDGYVGLLDYSLMKSNWFRMGDEE
ncbi:MAG: hypothetical protein AMXMBFR13_03780 [Phycisphaerae bacterium]